MIPMIKRPATAQAIHGTFMPSWSNSTEPK